MLIGQSDNKWGFYLEYETTVWLGSDIRLVIIQDIGVVYLCVCVCVCLCVCVCVCDSNSPFLSKLYSIVIIPKMWLACVSTKLEVREKERERECLRLCLCV